MTTPPAPQSPSPLRSILKSEAKDALIFSGSNLLSKFGSLLLLPIYWQKLTPADYGVLAIVAMIGSFQTLFGTLSLETSITRYYYQWDESDRRENLGAIWVWSILGSLFVTAVSLGVVQQTSGWIFPGAAFFPYLFLGIINNGIANFFIVPFATIRMRRLPWLFAAYNLGTFLIASSLGIWFVFVLGKGLWGYLIALIIANSILAVFGAFVMIRLSRPRLNSKHLKECVRFAMPAMPAAAISTLTGTLDRFLLNYFANLETLGIYAVAMRFMDAMSSLHGSLKMTYGPFMMKQLSGEKKKGAETVSQVTPYYMLPYFAAALGLTFFVRDFVYFAGRSEYFPVIMWIPWLSGVAIVTSLPFYYTNGLFLSNKTRMLSIPAAAQLAAVGISGLLLIKAFQLGGLVASRYVSVAVFFSVYVYLSQKFFPLPHRWMKLIGLFGLTAIFALAGSTRMFDASGLDLAFRITLYLCFLALASLIVAGRTFPATFLRFVKARIAPRSRP